MTVQLLLWLHCWPPLWWRLPSTSFQVFLLLYYQYSLGSVLLLKIARNWWELGSLHCSNPSRRGLWTWGVDTCLTIPKLKSCSWSVYVRLEQGSVQGWVSPSCSSFRFSYRELQNSSRKGITDWTQQEFLGALIAQKRPKKSHQTCSVLLWGAAQDSYKRGDIVSGND